jgi:hypothetical protein
MNPNRIQKEFFLPDLERQGMSGTKVDRVDRRLDSMPINLYRWTF